MSLLQAQRVLGRIAAVAAQSDVVLIGGQAVAFWAAELRARLPAGIASIDVTSKDIDLQGDRGRLTKAAELLAARVVLPHDRHRTSFVGVARFVDSDELERSVDFLAHPYGMTAMDIVTSSVPVDLVQQGSPAVRVRVMHPQRCLESRVHNSALPSKQTALAERQLRVAIACSGAFGKLLLDDETGDRRRDVHKLNERTFAFAVGDQQARLLAARQDIEVMDGLTIDERLGPAFHEHRLPQMREHVKGVREEDRARWSPPGGQEG